MSAVGRALRYLGLSGGDSEHSMERLARADGREGAMLGAGLSFRGEVTGDGDFHVAGKFEGESR